MVLEGWVQRPCPKQAVHFMAVWRHVHTAPVTRLWGRLWGL